MKCKKCNKDVFKNPEFRFQQTGWVDAYAEYHGQSEGSKEVTIDAGVFCSKVCLVDYLKERKDE